MFATENEGLVRQARRLRLNTLVGLRWLAVAGQTLAVVLSRYGLGVEFPVFACLAVVAASAALNLVLRSSFPLSKRLTERGAAFLLGYDVLQLALLLALTGGIANPFAILFLAPVTIAATSLSLRQALAVLALAALCATALARWSLPIAWAGGDRLVLPPLYLLGLWTALVISASFLTFYAHRVAAEAGQTASALAATELVLARAQHLAQLEGLAAAAAHELSTPLGTVALIAHEMAASPSLSEAASEDLQLLEESVDRCRAILGKMSASREMSKEALEFSTPVELAETAAAPHRLLGVSIRVEGEGADPAPRCPQNPAIVSALGNVIENAVGFAEKAVVIRAAWTQSTVAIVVADDGPGFPHNVLARIGEPYLSPRDGPPRNHGAGGGQGLGLFIASLFVRRSGGALKFANSSPPAKGAVVAVQWPRDAYERGQGLASGL